MTRLFFFFFKQKTAYEMRISDWSSDVCSSDLAQRAMRVIRGRARRDAVDPERVGMMGFSAGGHVCADLATRFARVVYDPVDASDRLSARPFVAAPIYPEIGRASCRERGCQYV